MQNSDFTKTPGQLQPETLKDKSKEELVNMNRGLQAEIAECRRIKDNLKMLSHAIEQSPGTVMITDARGNIEYVNPKFTQLTGYTPEEVLGKNPRILKPDNAPSEAYRKMWETIASGKEWHGEFCNKKKNGELYWEYASISPVRDEQGAITNYVAVKEDITERKRAEDELRKLSRAIEQSPSTVMITDAKGDIEYVNPKFAQLTGYAPEEAIGKNPRMLKPEWIPSEAYRKLWETITSGNEWHGEMCNKKKNGDLYWEYASISPVRNTKGDITHFIAVKEDITARKQAEEERNKHVRELEGLMDFSALMNESANDESLFRHLVSALRTLFKPDAIAIVMIDRERNMLYTPLIEPPLPLHEFLKNEAIFDPMLCTVIKTRQPLIVNNAQKNTACECLQYKIGSGGCACLPLTAGGVVFGMVFMAKKDTAGWDNEKARQLLSNYVGLAALGLHRIELLDIAKHTNVTDEITGVYNHRFFHEILNKQISLAKRRNENLSLLILVMDNYQKILDAQGKETSDGLLQQVARVLNDTLRDTCIVARYGNEGFAVIAPMLFKTKALVKADDLRRTIEYAKFENTASGRAMGVTVSIGVASFSEQAADEETLLKCANKALQLAGKKGGNKIAAL